MLFRSVGSLDSGRDAPFNELFLLGGPYSLRGYRYSRVGKKKFSNLAYNTYLTANPGRTADATAQAQRFFGGLQQVQYQGELQFPLIREADMFGVVFYDVGEAEDTIASSDKFFADVGFGIRWFSPIGPLRFEWGFPLNRDPLYNEAVVFEFSIGTPF